MVFVIIQIAIKKRRPSPTRIITIVRIIETMTNLPDRFWDKVNKDGPIPSHAPELGPCWLWTGTTRTGYGLFSVGGRGERRMISAHRLSFEDATGIELGAYHGCHHCDNRLCVNPSHIFKGTVKMNMDDMRSKDRQAWFKSHEVQDILNTPLTDTVIADLSKKYQVGRQTIYKVYRDAGVGVPKQKRKVIKLSKQDIEDIRSAPRARGLGVYLAQKYGVSNSAISEIRRGTYHNLPMHMKNVNVNK